MKISFDNQVQKANVHTKNQAQSTNKKNSLITYIRAHDEINEFFIHKFINQNIKAQINKNKENFHIENFLFLNIKYEIGRAQETRAPIVTSQLELILPDHVPNISR